MSTDAAMTPDTSGNVSANLSTDINDPANLNFEDESDETQTTVPEQAAEVEGEPDESAEDAAQESEESESDDSSDEGETEAEGDEPEATEVNLPDEALVTLSNGEKVPLKELKKGYFREADYTRSKQELGNKVRAVAEQATRIQNVTDAFVTFLAQQMPQEPTAELAMRDPQAFVQQKALYDAALARVQSVIELGTAAKSAASEMTETERSEAQRAANEKLLESLPQLRDPAKRQAFNEESWNTARHFGYSAEELASVTDHRLLILGHYAAKGLRAEQAEKKVQAKVQAAPKVTPAKTAQTKGNPQFLKNKEAMRRLTKTGSINDAMHIEIAD